MAEKTRRELLSAAMEGETNDTELDTETESISGEGEVDTGKSGDLPSLADGSGAPAEGEGEKDPKVLRADGKDPYAKEKVAADKSQSPDAKKQVGKDGKTGEDAAEKSTTGELKAPNSWKPAEREHWAKMPKEAQQAVQRRELEIQRSLSETSTIRRWANDFANVIAPYSHLIRAQNSTPLIAIQNLMQTSAGLTQGSSKQKASIVAQICKNFAVDITELDNELAAMQGNGGNQQNQGNSALPPAFAQALKPIYDFMGNIQNTVQQRDQQLQQSSQQVVEDFLNDPRNEFADDLADEMADIMEMAAKRGQKVTVPQAYQRAIRNNPEIEAIVTQRSAAARQNGGNMTRARRAASSVTGNPSGGAAAGIKTTPGSRREALVAAMEAQEQ
jgi:hypothetical protein